MEFTSQRNNLYDSVINEIEKLAEYERVLLKFSDEDLMMISKYEHDIDLIGFIQLKSYDIITDKLFRAFVNIEHAVVRAYKTVMEGVRSEKTTTATYTKEIFLYIYKEIDKILDACNRGRFYTEEFNQELLKLSFMDYAMLAEQRIEEYAKSLGTDSRTTISTEELGEATDRCNEKLKRFFGVMKTQLESRPYYNKSTIVMKHVYYITIMVSCAALTVTIQ